MIEAKEIFICEVCGGDKLRSILNLGLHPLCDDLIDIGGSDVAREYPIEILYCDTCHTAHQRFQVPKHELFQSTYHYRARVTGSVLSGMFELVTKCELEIGALRGKTVLDIGCNDGSLLNYFQDRGCRTVGVEPTGAAADSRHPTINAFFDEDSAKKVFDLVGCPDIITFTNVFAHIEDLSGLISNLTMLIGPNTVLVIENHYLGAILDYNQFDTFYHEHPRTYSFTSFEYIAKSLGLTLMNAQFVSRYGGNIRVFLGPGESLDLLSANKIKQQEENFSNMFAQLNTSLEVWRREAKAMIANLVEKHGRLRAKAFPGRSAILIKLLGLDENSISAVYEIKGSRKVGYYVPSTRIPILPEAQLFAEEDQTQPILNLAWHLPAEVRVNLANNGYKGEVIDIKEFHGVRV
jgi:SAM-dependent methyltransferase